MIFIKPLLRGCVLRHLVNGFLRNADGSVKAFSAGAAVIRSEMKKANR